jgi:hypothetical protein
MKKDSPSYEQNENTSKILVLAGKPYKTVMLIQISIIPKYYLPIVNNPALWKSL